MTTRPYLFAFLAFSIASAPVDAAFTGTITGPGTGILVSGGGHWATTNSLTLNWNIFENGNGSWHYEYSFTTPTAGGQLSHLIIELSTNVTASDILNFSSTTGTNTSVGSQLIANGNPEMPADVWGLRFTRTPGLDAQTTSFGFDIFRAPTWGDFYARDGNAGGGFNFAVNSGFLAADPEFTAGTYPSSPLVDDAYFGNHILRPDTIPTTAVPVPPTIVLAGFGMLSWLGVTIRRNRRGTSLDTNRAISDLPNAESN